METVEQQSERMSWPMFEPISEDHLEDLKYELLQATGIDLSDLPVSVVRPGDYLFDYHEAQSKLFKKVGTFEKYKSLLLSYGYVWPAIAGDQSAEVLRDISAKEDVLLDDTFAGFAYNIGGTEIMYPAIREDHVLEMANKYGEKEGTGEVFTDVEQAKTFLKSLAEKYFYHEAGHSVYMHILTEEMREEWDRIVLAQEELVARVCEVQKDKYSDVNEIPVGNEAFADLFSEIVLKSPTRLGSWKTETDIIKGYIETLKSELV